MMKSIEQNFRGVLESVFPYRNRHKHRLRFIPFQQVLANIDIYLVLIKSKNITLCALLKKEFFLFYQDCPGNNMTNS